MSFHYNQWNWLHQPRGHNASSVSLGLLLFQTTWSLYLEFSVVMVTGYVYWSEGSTELPHNWRRQWTDAHQGSPLAPFNFAWFQHRQVLLPAGLGWRRGHTHLWDLPLVPLPLHLEGQVNLHGNRHKHKSHIPTAHSQTVTPKTEYWTHVKKIEYRPR